ncbi:MULTISPECIES: roadblock/LC7 domain-containing protein [Actinomadura]|jgi:predicted regulator of Ras-like GTPase activity (Roadblock/LC7/MglB family)|uniref:Roadblock/LC7 domain-containing protein n=1 Tax=Actinomadura montaniterrae TaxID=1803903 RepID=A0A6L3VSI7_9ACTN|nr:roadblock/LC7 domain-containing protein [Actinomadura montaniterrae]KAB2370652.1 roadblock/LC7 domain-containing protein [Actinomadura montaniterrae]HEU5026132.1 roadblock/LC7 domain-containing protein [Spirillospora sp.]
MTDAQHSGADAAGGAGGELNWLLDSLVQRVAQVQNAVVLSSDGLRMAASRGLGQEASDHLAAVAASFQSLARGAGESFGGGPVRQTIVEMESAFLFVTAAGRGACLAVLADADADLGMIAYEMAMLVTRVGQHLSASPRAAAAEGGV